MKGEQNEYKNTTVILKKLRWLLWKNILKNVRKIENERKLDK